MAGGIGRSHKSCGKLIAVTVIIPVCAAPVEKADAAAELFLGDRAFVDIQRMQIAHGIASGIDSDPDMHVADPHIGDRVVRALHPDPDGIRRTGAVNIDLMDVCIGRTVLRIPFDMDTDPGIFDGGVADHGFSAAFNGNAVGDTAAVDIAAGKGIIRRQIT